MRKWLDRLLLLGVFCVLAAGLVRTVFFPKLMNYYENRYANQIPSVTTAGVLDGSFQSGVEAALADQVPMAQRMKKLYNMANTNLLKAVMDGVMERNPNRYFSFEGMQIFGTDYITYPTRSLAAMTDALDRKAENLNQQFKAHPELEFYVYYIEKDTDINFETEEKVGAAEYLFDQLVLPQENMGVFSISNFTEFQKYFYKTDHHWNWDGSYLGYTQILALLGGDEPLKPAGAAQCISHSFSGAKATTSGAGTAFQEDFFAYPYVFPPMTITIDGAPAENYGHQSQFLAGEPGYLTYGTFYGSDEAEVVFDTGKTACENLLVIGDSFDNAILKLLASSFHQTYSVDLRYYATKLGKPFELAEYAAAHQIDKVLLVGNIDYFTMDEFRLEG